MLKNFDQLPIDNHKEEIIKTIQNNQVVIIAGDTGSGKTTRIPQFCMEIGQHSQSKLIGCTQPRRLAAISVAKRVASELGDERLVNYKIRFQDKTNIDTRIKFMTDGILLAETQKDPLLENYALLIIDEAHERNKNIDFLLGYLKKVLPNRQQLKLVITSATIDTETFSRHFDNAPIISIDGRTYPVDVQYEPMEDKDDDYLEHTIKTVVKLFIKKLPEDTLVFLPTEKDIRSCCEALAKELDNVDILPLFGRLQAIDQQRIFRPNNKPKIVVATNIAETSITVPGIRYVVDSGLARMTYYNSRAKTNSLPIQKISRASCDQRKGRCGRIASGICIRLFTEEDYLARDQYTLPEIKRSNLAEVLLQMANLKLGDPLKFPFIDPPSSNAIRDGYTLLRELGAIDKYHNLTKQGKLMSNLPIDPCIARILIEASHNNCLKEIKIIAAVLAIQDPRIRPAEKEQKADAAHIKFHNKHSDFLAYLNIWNSFHSEDETISWSRLKKFCKTHFLSFQRMREWLDLHEQLSRLLARYSQFLENKEAARYDQIHRSLLSGFLRNIAHKQEKKIYQGAGNKELMVFPGSYQFQTSGQWIMAADFLETNRLYGLTVATIEPDWIEPLAKNLCKYSWSNPRWEKKTGQVTGDEKVTLFGLILVSCRKVNFGRKNKKNRAEARRIFIESALLTGEIFGNYKFLSHNLKLVRRWKKTEDRLRKRDILYSEQLLHQFYQERLADSIYDRASLNKYLKNNSDSALFMQEQDILYRIPDSSEYADFPRKIMVGSIALKVSYKFNPNGDRDGITIHIPLSIAETLSESQFDWLVPGFLREKLQLLLKGLPKGLRKKLVPVNLAVDNILDDICQDFGKGHLLGRVENTILKLYRFRVQRNDWPRELPSYLCPNFILLDEQGKTLAQGNKLGQLLNSNIPSVKVSNRNYQPLEKDKELIEKLGKIESDCWNFNELPSSIPLYSESKSICAFLYPYLEKVENKNKIKIKFSQNKKEAEAFNQKGMVELYKMQFSAPVKSLKKACSNCLSAPSAIFLVKEYVNRNEAAEALLNSILYVLCNLSGTSPIPDKDSFETTIQQLKKDGLYKSGSSFCNKLSEALRLRNSLIGQIKKLPQKQAPGIKTAREFAEILHETFPANFLSTNKISHIDDYIRQLKCFEIRLSRFSLNPLKDRQKEQPLLPHLQNLTDLTKKEILPEVVELVEQYEQLVNEFKISLFAPELKTKVSVSEKKLDLHWQKIRGYI